MKNNMTETCYYCGAIATTKEHVPPKCIFPESKDVEGEHRKELIRVPSCDIHNSGKSEDDLFLLFALLLHFDNNEIGKQQARTKLIRAVNRSPKHFKKMVKDYNLLQNKAAAIQIDRDRLNQSLEYVSRALFFYKYDTRLSNLLSVAIPQMPILGENGSLVYSKLSSDSATAVVGFIGVRTPYEGSNPKIFKFRDRFDNKSGIFTLEMVFYEAFCVFVTSSPDITKEIQDAV